ALYAERPELLPERVRDNRWQDANVGAIAVATSGYPGMVLGMLLGIFLYFIAGSGEESSGAASRPRRRPRSWHEFGRRVLTKTLERPGGFREAVLRHARFFGALAPKERESIASIVSAAENPRADEGTVSKIALHLAIHHQNWLKSKGRK
ncbi:MAG: hypothetical protein AAB250_18140, partial [Bdellovibrionota bacterium]